MKQYKYTFYDKEGKVIVTVTCVSETMFQFDYAQWYRHPIFKRAEVEIIEG